MVGSVPYVKATEPHMLETYTPEVTKSYITSRLESVAVVLRYVPPVHSIEILWKKFSQVYLPEIK